MDDLSYRLIIVHYKHTKQFKYGYKTTSPPVRMFQVTDPHYHIKSSKHRPPGLVGQWLCLQSGYNDYMATIRSAGPRMYEYKHLYVDC